MRSVLKLATGAALLLLSVGTASAFGLAPPPPAAPQVETVAQGCGPGWWRGPWGHCRDTPYYGPLPGGGYSPAPGPVWNGCAPGYWRGPWGHCRDTPYHGPLPGGGWQ